jgi:CelD/BcsL family acetyltransferase involved in cellulose biosynthesis
MPPRPRAAASGTTFNPDRGDRRANGARLEAIASNLSPRMKALRCGAGASQNGTAGRESKMASSWAEHPVPLWLNPPQAEAGTAKKSHERSGRVANFRTSIGRASLLFVEGFGFETASELTDAWLDLVSRVLEPNVFMEPGFALAAAQHLARTDRPTFIAVWETADGNARGRLLGLWPLVLPRGMFRSHVGTLWCHKQAALGVPLLDAECAEETIAAIFTWLAETYPRLRLVVFPKLIRSGPTFARLLAHALGCGLEWRLLDQYQRAVLLANGTGTTRSKEHRARLARQRRQLEKCGIVRVDSARSCSEIRDAAEAFLALEESGWKGARRTALLSDGPRAAFARTMTRRLAREGKCRIDALMLDGRPIAMGIVLRSRDRGFFWKIAYDEAFAAQSPGAQLAQEVTRIQQADDSCRLTDSCTTAGNPMIERFWPDRLPIVDLAMPLSPATNETLAGFAWRDGVRRRLRKWAIERVQSVRRKNRN